MKHRIKKRYIITLVIVLFLIFVIFTCYKIRNRPFHELETYLENTYPELTSDEAKVACTDIKIGVKELFKFALNKTQSSSLDEDMTKINLNEKMQILSLLPGEIHRKYNVTNKADILKIDKYCSTSIFHEIDLVMKYKGDNAENRNFIESYFFFDF